MDIDSMSSFRVSCRLAATMGRDRVYLAGDAAHVHSPIGGQGMNLGMQDAVVLGSALAASVRHNDVAALGRYDEARRAAADAVIKANAKITRLAMSRNPVQCVVRDHVVPRVLRIRPVARRIGMNAAGLARTSGSPGLTG